MAVCEKTAGTILRMKPSSNIDVCSRWLSETDSAVTYLLKTGGIPIRPVKDMDASLHLASIGGVIYNRELLGIKDILHVSGGLKLHLSQYLEKNEPEGISIVEEIILGLYSNRRLEEKIGRIVLSEDEISDDASPELRSIRRSIVREQESIKGKLDSLIRSPAVSKYLQDSLITMRRDRYVIPVKAEYRNEIKGLIHDSSSSGQTFFIEPLAVLESNNRISELRQDEAAEIERILKELCKEIGEVSENIKGSSASIFRLDYMFAKASYALSINAVKPELNKEGRIKIIKGRHPLIAPDEVVPVDFTMGHDYRCVVITGPNTGGKTVTLKTVGLFTLMAQAGLFVPASGGSCISIFREVFADIGDEQSIEQSLSTFSSHMKNIVHIIDRARRSHLVLLDELGAGTDPVEGAALAVSILETMRHRDISCIATTHYSELKMYALNTPGVINASCEFDIETLKPTFRLLMGIPGRSNAFEISKKLGLPANIVDQAKKHIASKDMDFESTISRLQQYREEMEKDRLAALKYKNDMLLQKERFENLQKELEAKKRSMLEDARREAYETVEKAKKDLGALLNSLSVKERVDINRGINKLLHENEVIAAPVQKEDLDTPAFDGIFLPGDNVFVKKLNVTGRVISKADENNEVNLAIGSMKVKAKITEIEFIGREEKAPGMAHAGGFMPRTSGISPEIDLRGENVEDAITRVDKYLDDARLSGLHQVTIIHGKGTGVLREGITDFLSRHHHVKEQRAGQYGEGESGVTVVTLK